MPGDELQPRSACIEAVAGTGLAGCPTASLAGRHASGQERLDADGTFAYFEIQSREPGKLSSRVAVLPVGGVVPIDEARRDFEQRHRFAWGNLELESVRRHRLDALDRHVHVIGTFDSARMPARDVEATLGALATDGQRPHVNTAPDVFELTTTWEVTSNLRSEPWIRSLQVREPDAAAKTSVTYPAPVPQSKYIPSTSLTTGTYQYANALGINGATVNVGLMESMTQSGQTSGCQIWQDHEAFTSARFHTSELHRPA